MNPAVTRHHVAVPQADLDDLTARLAAARLPGVLGDGSDETGFTTASARELLEHWRTRFDWRAAEADLDALEHLLVDVGDGRRAHVVRALAAPAGRPVGVPLVLLHGWPDSFLRYRHLLGPLTAAGHDVYLPSLPGAAWSDQATGPATVEDAATVIAAALTALGVGRFLVHGGDWGSAVAEQLALDLPEAVVALHLTDVPWQHFFTVERADATDAEQEFFARGDDWAFQAAYVSVQATQTTTLALALADSPLGLAAWWAEKYAAWTDRPIDLDEVLTQVCLTWFTRTEHAGMRYYAATGGSWDADDGPGTSPGTGGEGAWGEEAADSRGWGATVTQPVALAVFPADIHVPPREYAARAFGDLRRFTLMPRGGHFGALEEPDLLAADLLAFTRDL